MKFGYKSEVGAAALAVAAVSAAPFLGRRALLVAIPAWMVASRLVARGSRNRSRPAEEEQQLLRNPKAAGARRPVAVVTGTNSGIGFHTAVALAAEGYEVVITCRSAVLTLQTAELIETAAQARRRDRPSYYNNAAPEEVRVVGQLPLECDDFASVRAFASWMQEAYGGRPVKLLVNNAGGMKKHLHYSQFNTDLELHTAANFLGPMLLTELLLPLLEKTPGSRVVYVGSAAQRFPQVVLENGRFAAFNTKAAAGGKLIQALKKLNQGEGNGSGPLYHGSLSIAFALYGTSKLLNTYHAHHVARRYAALPAKAPSPNGPHRVYACSLHPGCVATNFQKDLLGMHWLNTLYQYVGLLFLKSCEEGAQTTLHCAMCPLEELELVDPRSCGRDTFADAVSPFFVECANKTETDLVSYGWDVKEAEKVVAWGKSIVGLPASP